MSSVDMGNSLVTSYESYYGGVIIVCDTILLELAQQDKV